MKWLLPWLLAWGLIAQVDAQPVVVVPIPSSSANLTITIQNTSPHAASATNWMAAPIWFVQTAVSVSPPCSLIQNTNGVALTTPALGSEAAVSCVLTFTRNAVSPIPTSYFEFVAVNADAALVMSPASWVVGGLVDLGIRIEPVHPLPLPGSTEALFRVVLANPSDAEVRGAVFGHCADFSPPPFAIDAQIPGGCAAAETGILCFDQAAFELALPPAPAHTESSCLIRARKPGGLPEGASMDVVMESFFAHNANGYWVADPNDGNDYTEMTIVFLRYTAVPALSAFGATALIALMLASAWRRR